MFEPGDIVASKLLPDFHVKVHQVFADTNVLVQWNEDEHLCCEVVGQDKITLVSKGAK